MTNSLLITGGCGFIGRALIKKLISEDFENIRILDNLSNSSRDDLKSVCNFKEIDSLNISNSPNGVELIVGDILDQNLTTIASKGCNTIIHLAANTGVRN